MEVLLQNKEMKVEYKYCISVSRNDLFTPNVEFSIIKIDDSGNLVAFDLFYFFNNCEHFDFEQNLLIGCQKMINILREIIRNQNYLEHDFSEHLKEKYIYINSHYTSIEQWGSSTKITTKEILDLFIEAENFLLRWNNKEKLLSVIQKLFMKLKEQDHYDTTATIDFLTKNNDLISLVVYKGQFEMCPTEYERSIKLPIHMIN